LAEFPKNLVTISFLQKYYQDFNEGGRLQKDNQHMTEFLVTSVYLQKYLRKNLHILDVGSGPGIYSILCAQKGTQVAAFDISKRNIEQLQDQIHNTPLQEKISLHQGNAIDLSTFPDDSFDLVLNMGPLYHLKTAKEKKQAIVESLRVLKPEGILFVAYINKYFKFYQRIMRNDNPIKWEVMDSIIKNGWKHDMDEEVFFFLFPFEVEQLFENYDGTILHHASTDATTPLMADVINSMDDEDFAKYMDFHLQFCEDPHLLGSSLHNLLIFNKAKFDR
jgi:ubiquinone/menaquinone biosynthesis C-methylase UbiE